MPQEVPEAIKVRFIKKAEPKQPLRNILELAKVMRAHREREGSLSQSRRGKSSERSSTEQPEAPKERSRPLLETLFPRLYSGRGKTTQSDSHSQRGETDSHSKTTGDYSKTTGDPCDYVDGWCHTHNQPWPCDADED